MTLKINGGSIESDGHVVLMPAGVTGTVTTSDGQTYDLGPSGQIAIEVDTLEHAAEVAYEVSNRVGEDDAFPDITHDEEARAQSRKNLGLDSKGRHKALVKKGNA